MTALFARFTAMTEEDIKAKELQYDDFTTSELNFLIFETLLSDNDRAIACKSLLSGKSYARIAEDLARAPMETNFKTFSENGVKVRKNQTIDPKIRQTILRILPHWNAETEKAWIEIAKIFLSNEEIKRKLHII